MKKLLLLLLLTIVGQQVQSQIFWNKQATSFSAASRGVAQISFANANDVWITSYDGVTPTNVIREWAKSGDGGLTWTNGNINLGSTDLAVACIHAVSSSTAFVASYPSVATALGGVWKTIDSGATWTKQPTALFNVADSFADVIYFWDANNGMVLGDPANGYFEIYTTSNGGTTWTRTPSANIPLPLTGEYGYVRNFAVFGNTIWCGTNKGRLYKSSDKGLNWTVSQSPITDFGSTAVNGSYAFRNLNEGLIADNAYNLYRTLDGGATWATEFPSGTRDGALCFVPGSDNTYVLLGSDLDTTTRGSSYTLDGGLTWIDINALGDTTNVNGTGAVAFVNETVGLAAGFSTSSTVGGIFKYVGTQLPTKSFSNDKLFAISPNPSNGFMKLSGKNINQVMVTDVLGKIINNTNYNALSNVDLDLSSNNAGIYFVKVTNDLGNTSTIKVIKL